MKESKFVITAFAGGGIGRAAFIHYNGARLAVSASRFHWRVFMATPAADKIAIFTVAVFQQMCFAAMPAG
tara:strand:- start:323 stop:532 length:210 start_codon:yes stop_codon:yes gene_type:complete